MNTRIVSLNFTNYIYCYINGPEGSILFLVCLPNLDYNMEVLPIEISRYETKKDFIMTDCHFNKCVH